MQHRRMPKSKGNVTWAERNNMTAWQDERSFWRAAKPDSRLRAGMISQASPALGEEIPEVGSRADFSRRLAPCRLCFAMLCLRPEILKLQHNSAVLQREARCYPPWCYRWHSYTPLGLSWFAPKEPWQERHRARQDLCKNAEAGEERPVIRFFGVLSFLLWNCQQPASVIVRHVVWCLCSRKRWGRKVSTSVFSILTALLELLNHHQLRGNTPWDLPSTVRLPIFYLCVFNANSCQ